MARRLFDPKTLSYQAKKIRPSFWTLTAAIVTVTGTAITVSWAAPTPIAAATPQPSPAPKGIAPVMSLTTATKTEPAPAGTIRYTGMAGNSLYYSARAAGASPAVVQQYLMALSQEVDLSAVIKPEDRFEITVSYPDQTSGTAQSAKLVSGALDMDGKHIRVRPNKDKSAAQPGRSANFVNVFDSQETETFSARGTYIRPISGRLTSPFGLRVHPVTGNAGMHSGMDIAAPAGTAIRVVRAGTIRIAGWHGGHGLYVKVAHGGGLDTGYAHMSRIAVNPGDKVNAGDIIGYVGSTGLSTGPHLHYEVFHNGRAVNPASNPVSS